MIHGLVNQSCEAILPIVVKNDARTQLVDTVDLLQKYHTIAYFDDKCSS